MSAVKQDTDNGVRHAIEVRGLDNRFGTQQVHQDLTWTCGAGKSLAWWEGQAPGNPCSCVASSAAEAAFGRGPYRGRDLLRAQWLARARMERRFGILFQKGALYSSLTVLENVALPLIEHVGLARPLAERLARSKLGLVGLPAGAGDKYPASLSGGMVKRAALARALALDANILFLDEPTAGLDPIGAASFDQLILTLRNALGLTVFLVTHDLDTLYTICDRVAVLANQKVLINDGIEAVERFKHPWIQEYHGPVCGRTGHWCFQPRDAAMKPLRICIILPSRTHWAGRTQYLNSENEVV